MEDVKRGRLLRWGLGADCAVERPGVWVVYGGDWMACSLRFRRRERERPETRERNKRTIKNN